jgi:hypothetical protein
MGNFNILRRLSDTMAYSAADIWSLTTDDNYICSRKSWPGWPLYLIWQDQQAPGKVQHKNCTHSCLEECILLRPVKDDLSLNVPCLYRVPCVCGKVYVGHTGHTIEMRYMEHAWHMPIPAEQVRDSLTNTVSSKDIVSASGILQYRLEV